MQTIVGVSGLYHDSAAAVVRGGDIIAAAQEERFSRRKHDPRFPTRALAWCIEQAGGLAAIDAAAFYEDPVLSLDRVLKSTVEMAPASEGIWPAAAASQLGSKLGVMAELAEKTGLQETGDLFIVDHHTSHAASAFFPSPFREAAVVVVDGVGEWASTTFWRGDGQTVTPLGEIAYPHSLGLLYSAFTHHCGLKVNSGEHKLMGLAPYGRPRFAELILNNMIDLKADGSFRLNMDYVGYLMSDRATNAAFEQLLGSKRRDPQDLLTAEYMDIAASIQAVLNEAMLRICQHALRVAGSGNLCLAGGVAMNCVTNGILRKQLARLNGLWIQPAAGDAGGALGAALQVAHTHYAQPRHAKVGRGDGQRGSLLGPAFTAAEVEQALTDSALKYHRFSDHTDYEAVVAAELAAGKIVGRFNGRMEYGPRALGNRSILADPRRPDGQSHINLRIKFRESWRPFAPAVLAEHMADVFELAEESPYMLLVAAVRERLRLPVDWSNFRAGDTDMMKLLNQRRSELPAITHVDYSARIQSVDAVVNPDFHRLLTRFHALTGCPVLVNTSFNQRGEPIVCTPADAALCFINTGIDVLAIERIIVYKQEQSDEIRAREGTVEYEPD